MGEVAPLRGGYAFQSNQYANEGIPIVRISNILSDGSVGGEFVFHNELKDDEIFMLENGDIVLAMSGATTGKVSILSSEKSCKYYQNQRVGLFSKTATCNYSFVATIVRSEKFLEQLQDVLVAGAQPNVSAKDIDAFDFSVPKNVEEQSKIGNFFRTLDRLITLHQRKLDKMKALKKAFLNLIFSQKLRFYGFNDSWERRKLKDVAEFNPKSSLPKTFEYVDLESVVGTDLVNHRTEESATAPSRAQRLAQQGDIFYQTVRPYQKNNYLFKKLCSDYVFSTGYAQMRPHIDNRFLFCILQTDSFVKVVLDNCTGTSYPAINSTDLSNIEVEISAHREEQVQIGNFFCTLDRLITLYQKKIDSSKEMKKILLRNMLI